MKQRRSRHADLERSCGVRQFKVPELLFDAADWNDIISWENSTLTEPPLTRSLTDDQILQIKEKPLVIRKYPNHTQSVERMIKLVTDASKAVYGFDARDGFIRARIQSRSMMPQFDSKKDFSLI
jgi:hypothetical protein